MIKSIKTFKKSLLLLVATTVMQCTTVSTVYAASTVDRVDIEVTVNEDGSAHFKEVWNATVEGGTEASKQLIQLNGSEITNFKVTNETGREYTVGNSWDSSKSRIDKYTSAGMQMKMNGDTTLFWGLGDYGSRAYILEYDVSNFIENCAEGQFSYFTFIPPNQVPFPKDMSIKIIVPEGIGIDAQNCFSYGFDDNKKFTSTEAEKEAKIKEESGENDVVINTIDISAIIGEKSDQTSNSEDASNKIEIDVTEQGEKPNILMYKPQEFTFGPGNYVVLLTKYDTSDQKFNTVFSSNKSFIDVLNEANEGMGLGVVTQPKTVKEIAVIICGIATPIILIVLLRTLWKRHKRIENKTGMPIKLNFSNSNIAIERLENAHPKSINILRNSEDKNIMYEVYTVGTYYKVVPSTYSIFTALIVKWIINRNIEIAIDEDDSISDFRLILKDAPNKQLVSNFEHELFKLFERIDNSDKNIDGVDLKKLDRWLKINSIAFLNWRDEILKAEARLLQSKGALEVVQMSERLQRSATFTEYNVLDAFKNMGNDLQSVKKHIRVFEYNSETVEQLKEYIVFSQLFDSTNVFLNQLEDADIDKDIITEILGGNEKDKLLMTVSRFNSIVSTRLENSKGKNIKQNRKNLKKAKKDKKKTKKKSKTDTMDE